MSDNFLQLNNDKTEVMIIAPDNITTKIRQVVGVYHHLIAVK